MFQRVKESIIAPERLIKYRNDRLYKVFLYMLFFAVLMTTSIIIILLTFDGVSATDKREIRQNYMPPESACVMEDATLDCADNAAYTVYETSGIGAALKKADMVVTGEGKIDKQTLMEKAPYGLAKKAQASGVRVIALAGRLDMPSDMREDTPFDIMMGTFEGDTGNQAVPSREKAKENLIALASRAAKLLQAKKL